MLGIFGVVEALDIHNQKMVFRSNRNYTVGQKASVRLQIPPGSGKVAPVQVLIEMRRDDPRGNLYSARVLSDLGSLEYHTHDPGLREGERAHVGIRVMSKDLPGYRAMTVDFSQTGAQLEIDAALPLDKILELNFDLGEYGQPNLFCGGRVVWCKANEQANRYRIGVEFLASDPHVQLQLKMVSEKVLLRAHSELRDLLDQANLLGPEAEIVRPGPVAASAAVPVASDADRRQAPRALVLPLNARLEGYAFRVRSGSLFLSLTTEDGSAQTLEFPQCQKFHDFLAAHRDMAQALRSWAESPALQELALHNGPGNWKQYQLLDERDDVILEIFSGQCRPAPNRPL